ncbi:MAG: restriction endonuclease subunit S [Alphaproteobacteria bacterium]|nr:restriction endonuclease subunit S [Alphaproteobacteria bacterium]
MKDLPAEKWETLPLGEICEFKRGLTYKKGDEVETGGTPVLRANNVDLAKGELDLAEIRYIDPAIEVPKAKKVVPGSLLICTASGSKKHLGKTALIEDEMDFAFGGFMGLLVPRPIILPRYLQWLLRSDVYWSFIDGLSDGANINNLKFKQLAEFPVPLPPLEEQQRIVAVLDEAFEGLACARAHAEANLQNAQELFESIKADELAYSGSDREEVILSDVAEINSSLVDPREDEYADMLHLGAGNMITGTDELVDVKTAREEKLKSGKYLFDEKTVLYSKIRPYLRKAARPDFQGLCSADVYPLTPKPARLDRDFLFHLLLGNNFTEYAISGSDRAGMPKVNRNHMFAYRFELPPLEAQRRIASVIDEAHTSCSSLAELAKKKLHDLDDLRQSLLHKAFAGELT